MIKRMEPAIAGRRRLMRLALAVSAAVVFVTGVQAVGKMEVGIDNFTFAPNLLRVRKGESVTWVNHDDIPHSIVLMGMKVHSPPMDTDGTFTLQFDKSGIYNYVCGLHPQMKGQIVVSG